MQKDKVIKSKVVTSQLQISQPKQTKENGYKTLLRSIKFFDMDALLGGNTQHGFVVKLKGKRDRRS